MREIYCKVVICDTCGYQKTIPLKKDVPQICPACRHENEYVNWDKLKVIASESE